jgi:hypothetical protein
MADRYLLESGAPDGYQLEDASGVLLLETQDNPPFGTRPNNLYSIQRSWPQRPYGRPVGASGDELPTPAAAYFGSTVLRSIALPGILLAWQLSAPVLPTQLRAPRTPQAAVVADVVQPTPLRQTFAAIDATWRIVPPLPTLPTKLVQPAVIAADNPPFDSEQRTDLVLIDQAWRVTIPSRILPSHLVQPATVVADAPPPIRPANIFIIQRAWPQRNYGRPVTSSGDAAAEPAVVNDPPWGRNTHLAEVLRVWRDPVAKPIWGMFILDEPHPSEDPPFGIRPWLPTVLRLWQPGPPKPQAHVTVITPSFVPPVVNDPPFGIRPWLTTTVLAWQPGPPKPWVPEYVVQPFIPAQVDQPPTIGTRGALPAILAAWQPGPPKPYIPEYLVQPFVPDAPPIIGVRVPVAVLVAWLPGPPMPARPRWLAQGFIPPPVDNPPFGMRGHDGLLGRRDWWDAPWPRQQYDLVVQDGGIPPYGGFTFTEIRTARDFVAALRDRAMIVAQRGRFFIVTKQGAP